MEWLFLLLPVAAASGWWAARRSQARPRSTPLPPAPAFFRGLNYLLNEQPDKALDVFLKLAEVDRVVAQGVRGRAALHLEIPKKGGEGGIRHAALLRPVPRCRGRAGGAGAHASSVSPDGTHATTVGAISCLKPHSGRTQLRVIFPPRATRSVTNGAPHPGQGSRSGRAQRANLHAGYFVHE